MSEKELVVIDWPTPQDYNEAVQNPLSCFSDPDLQKTKIGVNALGLPHAASGAFASVYKATVGSTSWAVRCFLRNRPEQGARYKHISDFVLFDNLDSTVDFYYVDQGIKVKGKWYPCLKMTWVEGLTLDRYIEESFSDPNKMTSLLKGFHQLVGELEGAGIGHGDLQHGNIIVTEQGLRLVDYDALFVPALAGLKSLEFGHPNYQHPQRTEDHYDPDVDNFSCWLIHASLLSLAIDPSLYKHLGGGDESIIFKRKDLENPETSKVFARLLEHDSEHIRETAHILKRMLWAAPNMIPYLGAPPEDISKLPSERPLKRAPLRSNGTAGAGEARQSYLIRADGTELVRIDGGDSSLEFGQDFAADFSDIVDSSGGANRDFSNIYDAIDSSMSDRQRQKRNPGAQLKKLTHSTFKAGRQARDRIHSMAEKLELSTMHPRWIARKMKDASNAFYDADYEEAAKIYLEVFKQVDQQRHDKLLSEVAVSLGYCFTFSGKPALAGNYFLLFLNEAKGRYSKWKRTDFASEEVRDAAFLLAVCKFEDGNENAAYRVLEDNNHHLVNFVGMIDAERLNGYVFRWTTYRMLHGFSLKLRLTIDDRELLLDFISAASMVFMDLLVSGATPCTDELIQSYMELLGVRARIEESMKTVSRAQELYFALADVCYERGFSEQAQVARFCGAVLQNSTDGSQREAMTTLANLGHTNVEDFARLATAAGAYLQSSHILKLLVSVGHIFNQIGSKAEVLDALRVACRFAPSCNATDARLIIDALEASDEDTISTCLAESYFSESCNVKVRDEFIFRLADYSRVKVLSVVVRHLVLAEKDEKLGELFHKLAERGDQSMLQRVLIAGSQSADGKGVASQARIIDEACRFVIERCKLNLRPAASPIDPDTFIKFSWNHYYLQISVLDSLRYYYKTIGNQAQADELLDGLVSDTLREVVTNWFFNLVSASNFDRYYGFVLELADRHHIDALERIVLSIVRNGQTTVLDGIMKNLTSVHHLDTIIELAERFADKNELMVFSHVTKEIARTAESDTIIDFMEKLVNTLDDGATYASNIVTHLILLNRPHKASRVLSYLHQQDKLSSVAVVAPHMIGTTYNNSVFEQLMLQKDYATLAALTCCIATSLDANGLKLFFKLLQEGATSEEGFKVTEEAFAQCCSALDNLLTVKGLSGPIDPSDSEVQKALVELDSKMEALHNLRTFIGLKNLNQLMDQASQNYFARSLNDRYDPLITAWVLNLARQREFELINSVASELAQFKKEKCLSGIVYQFTRESQQEALYGLTAHLAKSGDLDIVLDMAFQLAKHHTFEAKTIMSQIIQHTTQDSALLVLVDRSAEINNKLADLLVRQLAVSGRGDVLKPMAVQLAKQGKTKALYLVLTQLLSVDPDFLAFVNELCETDDHNQIGALALWFAESGMTGVIRNRVETLRSRQQPDAADLWSKYLPVDE